MPESLPSVAAILSILTIAIGWMIKDKEGIIIGLIGLAVALVFSL